MNPGFRQNCSHHGRPSYLDLNLIAARDDIPGIQDVMATLRANSGRLAILHGKDFPTLTGRQALFLEGAEIRLHRRSEANTLDCTNFCKPLAADRMAPP